VSGCIPILGSSFLIEAYRRSPRVLRAIRATSSPTSAGTKASGNSVTQRRFAEIMFGRAVFGVEIFVQSQRNQ
jgi:hypothetical protein